LLVLLVTLIGACLVTLDIVSEKESGIWEQLQATPLSLTVYIVSKMVVFAVAGLFVLGVGLLLCHSFFGFALAGRWYVFWLLALAFLWPMLMIGIGIASISKNQVQAIYLLVFVLLTIILMSSMFSFLNAMPGWARATRFVNPLYFMLDASRLVALKGFSLADVWSQFAALCIQGAVLSVLIFRRMERTK
jgi:ABC-2 type transport system permease protein